MERFSSDMISNLYGNPHSGSASSQLSTNGIEDVRLKVLQFFKAEPEHFDLVFVANSTAGIKLVMDAFCACEGGFSYGYHKDSHTSMIGVRENARSKECMDDEDVEQWLAGSRPFVSDSTQQTGLFAYPAQSNMDGRKLPLSWSHKARKPAGGKRIYSLLDAAALVATSPLDLSNPDTAPDFTVLSFNKIFGFPDLGALITRKESGQILKTRKYFGGGTVEMVLCVQEQWHMPKDQSLHESLEDGTLPIHNILALNSAIDIHAQLFESMDRISRHTMSLARKLYTGLMSLQHANGEKVCEMYTPEESFDPKHNTQGPNVAFNLKNGNGAWVSNHEIEKLASVKNIHIRSGGLCNPGGITTALDLNPWEMKRNFSAGFRCGNENDVQGGKPTGVVRASLGAMSNELDVNKFLSFVEEFYMERKEPSSTPHKLQSNPSSLFVESLAVYPIKSCGRYEIPHNIEWELRQEGLAWDREWCLLHSGTGQALSQKRYPKMTLIRPEIDFDAAKLVISYHGQLPEDCPKSVSVPLSADPSFHESVGEYKTLNSQVCGDAIVARTYSSKPVNDFFSTILGVKCTLARFPAGGSGPSARHAKAHMQEHQKPKRASPALNATAASTMPLTPPDSDTEKSARPILLSNESPILMINRSSVNALNQEIERNGGKLASASVFRANVVIASSDPSRQDAYSEDLWSGLQIRFQEFRMLGACRRCHMVCIDQKTAVKDEEPFVTLAKTRRFEAKVFFGTHMCHVERPEKTRDVQFPTIKVGDPVVAMENGNDVP